MTLEEVLRYTKAALKDACFAKKWIEGIQKFIQNQADENRRLRYERLMWKAACLRREGYEAAHESEYAREQRCDEIAEALEERARKIKEEK